MAYRDVNDIAAVPDEDWLGWFRLNVKSGVRASRGNMPNEMLDYGTSKTAQLGVSRGPAEAVAGTGVTVNAVLPGPTRSEIIGNCLFGADLGHLWRAASR